MIEPNEDGEVEFFEVADLDNSVDEAEDTLEALRAGDVPDPGDGAEPLVQGTGEAADGRVRVTARAGGDLESVVIDPRALRADRDELGQHLVTAVNAALDDVERAATQADPTPIDREAIADDLATTQELAASRLSELSTQLDDALMRIERATAGEDLHHGRR